MLSEEMKTRLGNAYIEVVNVYMMVIGEEYLDMSDVRKEMEDKLDYVLTVLSHDLKEIGVEIEDEED